MTNQTKYTPAPWAVFKSTQVWTDTSSKESTRICYCENGMKEVHRQATKEEIKANAQLIAAAPELLEAFNNCIKTLSDDRIGSSLYMEGSQIYSDFEAAIKQAKIAINKAEGKQSCQ